MKKLNFSKFGFVPMFELIESKDGKMLKREEILDKR